MVNPVKYDRTQVVNRACQLFWQKGFYGTSTRDLQAELDMRPGSIYAAFGSKEGLYKEALLAYADTMKEKLQACIESEASILAGLEAFLRQILVADRDKMGSEVCMFARAQTELLSEQSELKATCGAISSESEAYAADLFEQAQKAGEISGNLTPIEYARYFDIQLNGLRAYMLRCQDNQIVDGLIKQVFRIMRNL